MANEITFKVPTNDGLEERCGKVAVIKIGDKPYKFVMQVEPKFGKVVCLTHYASGRVFGWFNDSRFMIALDVHKARNGRRAMSPRQRAEFMVAHKVETYGADKIMHSIDNAEVVNG